MTDYDETLINPLIEFIQREYSDRTTEYDKCRRDLNKIVDSMFQDIQENTNRHTKYIASKFWSRGEPMLSSTEAELATYDELYKLLNHPTFGGGNKFKPLIDIVKDWVQNGPKFEYYEWQGMLNNRVMTFNWRNQIPPQKHIEEIIHELHEYVPSKQRRVRYKIDIVPNFENEERKLMIYSGTKAKPDKDNSRYNPQVLAPWLLIMSNRYEAIDGVDRNYFEQEAALEIGLVTEFINLAALNRGIDVGFCACIQNRDEVKQRLGVYPVLYLGLGYKDSSSEYFCPIKQSIEHVPIRNYYTKPELNEYTRWH